VSGGTLVAFDGCFLLEEQVSGLGGLVEGHNKGCYAGVMKRLDDLWLVGIV